MLFLQYVNSQSPPDRFINFSSKDGLADKFTYSATQDVKGYMWIGTSTGLYRYDGHVFKKYRSTIDKPGRSISNVLQSVMTDKAGNLWLGSFNTLQWYNPEKNIFWQPDEKNVSNKNLFDAYIYNITEGASGAVYISTIKQFFFRFRQADSSFFHFGPYYPSSASRTCINVFEYNETLFAVHREGIYQFKKDGRLIAFYNYGQKDISSSTIDYETNCIWLATYANGVISFDFADKKFHDKNLPGSDLKNHNLLSISPSGNDQLLLAGYKLFRFNKKNSHVVTLSADNNQGEFHLFNIKAVGLFTDREKNTWICSHKGLSLMPWQNNQVSTVTLYNKKGEGLVEPIAVFGLSGAGNYLITNSNSSGLLAGTDTNFIIIENPVEKNKLEKSITGLVITPEGGIYASDEKHFFKINPETKSLSPFSLVDQYGNSIKSIRRSIADRNGNIYIGSPNNGMYNWDGKSNHAVHINKWEIDAAIKRKDDNELYPTLVDSKGNIWFTSNNGVYQFNSSKRTYSHHAFKSNGAVAAMGASFYIAEDRAGHFWITTINSGLYELYFENGKEVLINYAQNSGIGLPSDYNKKIQLDTLDGTLWISNVTGLLKFDPVNKKVLTVLDRQNGMADDGGYSFTITPDHKLLHLFYGQMSIIDLHLYQYNKMAPVVAFNSIKVMDKEYVFSNNSNKLRLSSDQNFLQIEFAALLFNNGNKNQYKYKLEGINDNWVFSGRTNTVNYSGLKPGRYTFLVAAANSDGVWGKESRITITILPPFYASWWFITTCGLILTGLLYLFYKYRINRVRKEEKLKSSFQQQIAETEMKALRAQMNPHFIFNSLNSINRFILKKEPTEASHYLVRFSRLIRLILDHSNQQTISLESEIELLELYIEMEQLRFEESFDYQFILDKTIEQENTFIPSMLIQPYVENAIRHGLLYKKEKGMLKVEIVRSENNVMEIKIEDNGVGREKSAELIKGVLLKKKSYGMQITNSRIAILNKTQNLSAFSELTDLYDEKGNAAGTRVVISIPLKN